MSGSDTPRGFVVRPGEGEAVWSLGGYFHTTLDGERSGGQLALVESRAWRSTEPPLHVHHREHEAWYVLEGQMTFRVGDDTLVAPVGSFAFAPKGIPHGFTVDVEPTRVLVFAMPAGFERFATELGVPADSTTPTGALEAPPPEILGPVAERYGIEVVGPPLRVMMSSEAPDR
ncbi:MAG TPA: quercetin 2,3-dioxygenase [Candidatus Limnocylindria bacterium]|nr:quercetin 2,3-dioxygenase [Candidatus Limnocylindria bacterium]